LVEKLLYAAARTVPVLGLPKLRLPLIKLALSLRYRG
jgi:hypothetical protein